MFSSDSPVGLRSSALRTSGEFEKAALVNFDQLVHPQEKLLFGVSLVLSLFCYLMLFLVTLMTPTLLVLLVYIIPITLYIIFDHGIFLGSIRGNGIRVSPTQFPEVFSAAQRICDQMGMAVPDIYIIESGGMLNAFAMRFLMRDYVVLFSDIVEMAYEQGEEAVNFVVAHEMAHIKRGHLKKQLLLLPAFFVPFLGNAYYRACEYTCDCFGAYCVPKGGVPGILALSAGKKLYRHVNVEEFCRQAYKESGFWVWFAELLSTHPRLSKRLEALRTPA